MTLQALKSYLTIIKRLFNAVGLRRDVAEIPVCALHSAPGSRNPTSSDLSLVAAGKKGPETANANLVSIHSGLPSSADGVDNWQSATLPGGCPSPCLPCVVTICDVSGEPADSHLLEDRAAPPALESPSEALANRETAITIGSFQKPPDGGPIRNAPPIANHGETRPREPSPLLSYDVCAGQQNKTNVEDDEESAPPAGHFTATSVCSAAATSIPLAECENEVPPYATAASRRLAPKSQLLRGASPTPAQGAFEPPTGGGVVARVSTPTRKLPAEPKASGQLKASARRHSRVPLIRKSDKNSNSNAQSHVRCGVDAEAEVGRSRGRIPASPGPGTANGGFPECCISGHATRKGGNPSPTSRPGRHSESAELVHRHDDQSPAARGPGTPDMRLPAKNRSTAMGSGKRYAPESGISQDVAREGDNTTPTVPSGHHSGSAEFVYHPGGQSPASQGPGIANVGLPHENRGTAVGYDQRYVTGGCIWRDSTRDSDNPSSRAPPGQRSGSAEFFHRRSGQFLAARGSGTANIGLPDKNWSTMADSDQCYAPECSISRDATREGDYPCPSVPPGQHSGPAEFVHRHGGQFPTAQDSRTANVDLHDKNRWTAAGSDLRYVPGNCIWRDVAREGDNPTPSVPPGQHSGPAEFVYQPGGQFPASEGPGIANVGQTPHENRGTAVGYDKRYVTGGCIWRDATRESDNISPSALPGRRSGSAEFVHRRSGQFPAARGSGTADIGLPDKSRSTAAGFDQCYAPECSILRDATWVGDNPSPSMSTGPHSGPVELVHRPGGQVPTAQGSRTANVDLHDKNQGTAAGSDQRCVPDSCTWRDVAREGDNPTPIVPPGQHSGTANFFRRPGGQVPAARSPGIADVGLPHENSWTAVGSDPRYIPGSCIWRDSTRENGNPSPIVPPRQYSGSAGLFHLPGGRFPVEYGNERQSYDATIPAHSTTRETEGNARASSLPLGDPGDTAASSTAASACWESASALARDWHLTGTEQTMDYRPGEGALCRDSFGKPDWARVYDHLSSVAAGYGWHAPLYESEERYWQQVYEQLFYYHYWQYRSYYDSWLQYWNHRRLQDE